MEWLSKSKILIVGLGLMGGSYAKALGRIGFSVTAIDTNENSIAYAKEHGMIDDGYTYPDEKAIGEADAIIFALYPRVFVEWIRENQRFFKSGAMITDVTGVKSPIVYRIQDMLRGDVEFVAAHPMAGREVYGVENSDDRIFRDANYIIVKTDKNTDAGIEWCRSLGHLIGCTHTPVVLPEEHDEMIGFVSQLTHCIAIALMTCSDNGHLAEYTGDSFRDLTRIARINDAMWSELFLMNRAPLLHQMDTFIKECTELRDMLCREDSEGLRAKMRLSTERRALFDKKK